VLDRTVHVHFAVHARHAEVERVGLGEGADPEQRRDHGDPGLLGESPHLVVGAAEDHPVPHHEKRSLGRGDQTGGLPNALIGRCQVLGVRCQRKPGT